MASNGTVTRLEQIFERKNNVPISKFFVINVTKLWIFLQKYPSKVLITFTKIIPTLYSLQLYENQ